MEETIFCIALFEFPAQDACKNPYTVTNCLLYVMSNYLSEMPLPIFFFCPHILVSAVVPTHSLLLTDLHFSSRATARVLSRKVERVLHDCRVQWGADSCLKVWDLRRENIVTLCIKWSKLHENIMRMNLLWLWLGRHGLSLRRSMYLSPITFQDVVSLPKLKGFPSFFSVPV